MIAAAASRASGSGMTSISRTKASAANRHIDPCAKLKTAEALKIRTKPSATREYSTPVSSPPIKTSRKKKSILPLAALQGGEGGARRGVSREPAGLTRGGGRVRWAASQLGPAAPLTPTLSPLW